MNPAPLPALLLAALAAGIPAQVTTLERPVPALAGWNGASIHTAPGGVWYARVDQVIPDYGAPEVIVADDAGRITVLSVYSGKWTDRSTNPDGQWLAPSHPADVDPRVQGKELYAAGKGGNVHRVRVVDEGAGQFRLESVEIAHVASEEFHAILAADLAPGRAGDELLVFGITGAVYQLEPSMRDGDPHGSIFTLRRAATIPGRVRDVVLLPGADGAAPRIVGVSRAGDVLALTMTTTGLEHTILAHEPMGLGRIARRQPVDGRPETIYVTRDDGVVVRFELPADGTMRRDVIFAGAQGLRGVAAGRFHDEPEREAIAVYGYGTDVQLVSRSGAGPWEVETIFTSDDQGHWLTVGEFDGRNGTDELIATGFGGQVVLLARPPGCALPGAAVEAPVKTDDRSSQPVIATAEASAGAPDRPWRIAVKGSEAALELSPLNYQGGFETKSLVYETLVRRGPGGRIVSGLATSWSLTDDGRTFTFHLRPGATFHDGEPVTAAAVATHFRRWVGLPEHGWLRCNDRIQQVKASSDDVLQITLDRACALLPDLCAINPTAIRGPGALDREGAFVHPVGSGPFAFVGALEAGRVLRYRRDADGPVRHVDLVRLDKSAADDPLDALLRGEVDIVLSSWLVTIDPARVAALRTDPRYQVIDGPGSSMTYLGFRYADGPTATRGLRRRIAAAIDRDELIRVCEHGLADPSTGWAAPSVSIWPQGTPPRETGGPLALERPLRIFPGPRGGVALAATIAAQLTRAGIPTRVAETADSWDMRVEVTHGVPYDPYTTAVSRFTPPINAWNAESPRFVAVDPAIVALVERAMATADDDARYRLFAEIQAQLDEDATIVPLYAPRRVGVLRAGVPLPRLEHDMYTLDARWLTDS